MKQFVAGWNEKKGVFLTEKVLEIGEDKSEDNVLWVTLRLTRPQRTVIKNAKEDKSI